MDIRSGHASLSPENPKILLMSSVASTLWVFYRGLIQQLVDSGYDVAIAAADDYNLPRFHDEYHCTIVNLDIKRKVAPLHDIRCIIQLARFMRKEKYDLIHAHTPKAGMLGMIAAFLAKVPVRMYTLHGLPLETASGLKRNIFWAVERLTMKCATHRLIVSHSLADRAEVLGICKEGDYRILVDGSACGVDRNRFHSAGKTPQSVAKIKNELDIPQNGTVIGFVGRITPDKGIDCLLSMFEQLSQNYDKLYLLVIADVDCVRGQSVDEYTLRIAQHSRIKHFTFVDDIVSYYYAMDVLVLPSKREGFNYALLEAAACGLPTVTTDATGCVDVVVDGMTGFVVPLGDYDGFKDAVERLISNPQLRLEMGQKGEKRVAELFDSQRLIQEHLSVYSELINPANQS